MYSISRYEVFIEVARTKSLSKTAINMHQTVPGISYSIGKLEEEVGLPLFIRQKNSIELSEYGKNLYPFIKDVLAAQRRLDDEIAYYGSTKQGTVKIGGLQCVGRQWFPQFLKQFEIDHPTIKVKILFGEYTDLTDNLIKGKLDFAIAGEQESKQLDFKYLTDDPFYVIVQNGSALGEKTSLSLSDIKYEKIIAPVWSGDSELMSLYDSSFSSGSIIYRIKDTGTILSMVESGMGISIIPRYVISGERIDVKAVEFTDWKPKKIGILTANAARMSPAVRTTIKCLTDWIRSSQAE